MSAPTPAIHCQFPVASAGSSSIRNRSHSSRPTRQSTPRSKQSSEAATARTCGCIHPVGVQLADSGVDERIAGCPGAPRAERGMRSFPPEAAHLRLQRFVLRCCGLNHESCRKKSRCASARKKQPQRKPLLANRERICEALANGERDRRARDRAEREVRRKPGGSSPRDGTLASIAYCGARSRRNVWKSRRATADPPAAARRRRRTRVVPAAARRRARPPVKRNSSGYSCDAIGSSRQTSKYGAKAR